MKTLKKGYNSNIVMSSGHVMTILSASFPSSDVKYRRDYVPLQDGG